MFTKSLRAAIPTSLWLTVFLAAGLVGCAPAARNAQAKELTTNEYCSQIQTTGPHLILWFDGMGNQTAIHGGTESAFPPRNSDGTTPGITQFVSVPVMIFEGSTWFCYKIGGQRKCIKY